MHGCSATAIRAQTDIDSSPMARCALREVMRVLELEALIEEKLPAGLFCVHPLEDLVE